MNRRPFIYIAGPYRGTPGVNGDHMSNCHDAYAVWHHFWQNHVCAICPHWSCSQQLVTPLGDCDWLAFTMAQMTLCKAVYRMPGHSSGSDAEVRAARELGIPVFHDLAEAVEFMRGIGDGKVEADEEGCCGEADCWYCGSCLSRKKGGSQTSGSCWHNTGACVWRFTDCSGRQYSLDPHDSHA